MNVLVLTDMFPSKEEPAFGIFIYELSKAISCKNQVIVIHPQIWDPLRGKFYRKDNYYNHFNDIEVYRPRLFIPPKGDKLFLRAMAFFLIALPLVKKLRKQFYFDLIHVHMAGPAGFAAVLLGMIFSKPVIVTAHGSDIHSFPKHFFLKQLVIFTLKKATKVVAVSQSLKESISKMVGSQKELFVIRNGVNYEIFSPMDKTKTREMLNLPNDIKIILFIGSLLPIKGVDLLLHAFADINKRDHINLIIIGKGNSEQKLKDLTKELHIGTQVSFIGTRKHDEIPLWLNACDLLCFPSHNEGFPTVVVEAFACGCPVVATKVGGIPEAITNDTLGILVEPNNKEELTTALNKALEKEWDYPAIAEYGKRFSWDTIAEEYSELYKNVVLKK
ncbi:MAG: glycosyltransferase family 4 protein [Candidatus Brocadiales bacterium]|nr:glycosyltransferase family 4 protein [Candidatus Brocadiales bacterium]